MTEKTVIFVIQINKDSIFFQLGGIRALDLGELCYILHVGWI